MSIVWLNGALVEHSAARIDPADRGFTLGDGVFETIRVQDGVPAHAARHFARLRDGAGVLGIAVPLADDALFEAACAVAHANNLAQGALRLTLTRGPAPRGVLPTGVCSPTALITAGPLPATATPARVVVPRRTCRNELSPLARIKSLNYLDSILARNEAEAAGADDALLLNTRGDVAEGSAANVFVRLDGAWVTPTVEDGALPGIARARLLEAGWAVAATVSADSLRRASAGLLVNALSLRKIASIDGRGLETDWPLPAM